MAQSAANRPGTGRAGGPEVKGNLLLVNDTDNGSIYRLDTRAPLAPRTLTQVPIDPDVRYNDTDGIYALPRYGASVLLMASHAWGIQVLASRDGR